MTPAILPALMSFSSWVADIAERLARNVINEEQALAEMEERRIECVAEVERARAKNLSDRAILDAEARKKFAPTTPAPAAPATATTPAPSFSDPHPTGES